MVSNGPKTTSSWCLVNSKPFSIPINKIEIAIESKFSTLHSCNLNLDVKTDKPKFILGISEICKVLWKNQREPLNGLGLNKKRLLLRVFVRIPNMKN